MTKYKYVHSHKRNGRLINTMRFKNDEQVLAYALVAFKKETRPIIQEVVESDDGSLSLGELRYFNSHIELRSWICSVPGSSMYISVVKTKDSGIQIGYRGKKFATIYQSADRSPHVSYYRNFNAKIKPVQDSISLSSAVKCLSKRLTA